MRVFLWAGILTVGFSAGGAALHARWFKAGTSTLAGTELLLLVPLALRRRAEAPIDPADIDARR